jgi:guanylate kinase
MKQTEGALIVVSGPSGAGKSTLLKRLMAQHSRFVFAVSCTTRNPRQGEQDGREYYFVSLEEFEARIARSEFAEWEALHGNHYGTLKDEIARLQQAGSHVLLDLDVLGALNLRLQHPEAFLLFIAPPSVQALEQRLTKRGSETQEQIRIRLDRCESEMARSAEFDAQVVNDELEESYRCLLASLADFVEEKNER